MVRLNRIYTRTGDDGTSGLVDGSRRPKHDALFAAIGDVDELNSAIGLAAIAVTYAAMRGHLSTIQNDLFDLGADLATPASDGAEPFAPTQMALRVLDTQVARLEGEIDAMNEGLAPLTSFILPGGSEAAARLHLARAIARRAERSLSAAGAADALNPAAGRYINRLSDWLFVAARFANGGSDPLWVPGASR